MKYFSILSVVLLLCNVMWAYLYFNHKDTTSTYIESTEHYITDYSDLKTNLQYSLRREYDTDINETIFTDTIGIQYKVKDLFIKGKKEILCCRTPKASCKNCIQYVTELSKKMGLNDLIYIVDEARDFQIKSFANKHIKENGKILMCNKLNIEAEDLLFPYYFTLNKNGMITSLFIPFSGKDELDSEMIEILSQRCIE